MRRGPIVFLSPNNKGSFFSLSPENQKNLNLQNPVIQVGDIWKAQEVLLKYKEFCEDQKKPFDLREFFHLPKKTLFLSSGEFGKDRLRGTSKMDRVSIC